MKSFFWVMNQMPLGAILIVCVTLGLAPFSPPHVVEKLTMLVQGTLVRPIDWFDLLLHGTPWLLLVLKLAAMKIANTHKPERKG